MADGRYWLSHDAQDIDDTIDEVQAARGSEASLSARLSEIVGDFEADQQRQETEIGVVAALGAKNLLYISNTPGYTATSHGRTFTVLSDGGIKITGASSDSSNADFYVIGSWSNRSILLNENRDACLIRMSCDTDYGYNQMRLRAMNRSTGSTVNETGVETNKDVMLSHIITTVLVSVFPSVTLPEDGIVIYPMIRRAEITDSTYVPYAPTNRELYEQSETKVTMQQAYGDGTLIETNSNLNTYTTPGLYYATIAVATTVTNTPYTETGFRLVVEKNTPSSAAVFQTLYPTSRLHLEFFRRVYEGGSWSSWYKFEGTQVATIQSASSASLMQAGRLDAELSDAQEVTDHDT